MESIETERLIIRNFKYKDWRDMKDYLSYEEVVKYSPYKIFDDEMAPKEILERIDSNDILAVELKKDYKVIGEIIFENGEFDAKEIGFFLNPKYQGQGLRMKLVMLLLVGLLPSKTLEG